MLKLDLTHLALLECKRSVPLCQRKDRNVVLCLCFLYTCLLFKSCFLLSGVIQLGCDVEAHAVKLPLLLIAFCRGTTMVWHCKVRGTSFQLLMNLKCLLSATDVPMS